MKFAQLDTAGVENKSRAVIERALDTALRRGASAAEASAACSRGGTATVRVGELETLEYEDDQSFDVTVYFGTRKGSASSSDLSADAVVESVKAACDIARYAGEDEHAGLAERDEMASEVPDLLLDHPWIGDVDRIIRMATECEDAARAVPEIVNSEGAGVKTRRSLSAYGNTHGFLAAYTGTVHAVHCIAVAGRGDEMQRDFWSSTRRDPSAMQTPQSVGRQAADRAVARLGARKLTSRKARVLFTPQTARTLVGCFIGAISGGALYRGTSFLIDSLGTQVFPSWLVIDEEPHLPGGLYSAAFDSEGVATREHTIVADGVVRNYVLDTYSARKLGLKTTGNAGGVRNLILRGRDTPYDDLVAGMDEGLIVVELIGSGINMITGDYSQGAAGFWVQNGKIAHPVEEVTLAGNLRTMFMSVAGLGQDLDEEGSIRCGSMLIEGMTIAGI